MRALIADDDPVYRCLLEKLLTEWGYEVTAASDGTEAWEAIQTDKELKLAVLDWMMPGMDGYDVCRLARQEAGKDIYFILVTGSAAREDILRVLVAGADDYILKPFEAMDLQMRLRAAQRIIGLEAEVAQLRRKLGRAVPAGQL
jgi:CheY-like chemotaxis protein